MNLVKTIGVTSLICGAAFLSGTANASAKKYEGLYLMEQGCKTVSLSAGVGFVAIDPDVNGGSVSFDAIEQSETVSISMSCDDATLDEEDVDKFVAAANKECLGLQIPWRTPQERLDYCADLAQEAVDAANAMADYVFEELVSTVNINMLKNYWIGSLGEMDYVFADGRTEYRGPNTAVWNNGRYYRGITGESHTPNWANCPSARVGKMDANIDLSSSFGGGARIYLDTNIVDGVVCPVFNPFSGQLVFAGWGFTINFSQQGDRQ